MKRYLKLVNFEFSRFLKLYLVLVGITVFFQVIGVIFTSKRYLGRAEKAMVEDMLSKSDFISQYGKISMMDFVQTLWFMGPIMLSGATLLIYVFFIWYRDWLGKNTFSYRLLVLPTARLNVYLAKATTVFLFVLGLIAVQLVLLPVESRVLQWMVPGEFRNDFTLGEILNINYLQLLYPKSFLDFILYYGTGLAGVCVVFTAILFERSYRLKGIFLGILYCGITFLFLLSPLLVDEYVLGNYFYPNELFYLVVGAGLVAWAAAIWIGNYLLNKKIRV
ncbi:hypothetical protein E1I69_21055 [Bacillus timonensis]|uniref:Uncharacterized protein n=1 Tax=Bacillus timonensis TaxID=1033734 RepID=A0A4S3PKF0_9BACI|nr:hypothetical protein [Bacillus timonensis]THE09788.1 hypothetical protein E1I69_21055 [Bacillus timonensis]